MEAQWSSRKTMTITELSMRKTREQKRKTATMKDKSLIECLQKRLAIAEAQLSECWAWWHAQWHLPIHVNNPEIVKAENAEYNSASEEDECVAVLKTLHKRSAANRDTRHNGSNGDANRGQPCAESGLHTRVIHTLESNEVCMQLYHALVDKFDGVDLGGHDDDVDDDDADELAASFDQEFTFALQGEDPNLCQTWEENSYQQKALLTRLITTQYGATEQTQQKITRLEEQS